jgi:hypothetical protein
LVVALAGFVFLLVRHPPELEPVLVLGAVFPFLSAASSFTYWIGEPRYLVFLAPAPTLLIAWTLVRARPAVATVGMTLAFVASLVGLIQLERQSDFLPGRSEQHGPYDIGPVVEAFERENVDRVRANYWIAYRITFESEERVIASPGFWRYKPYRDLVAATPRPGRVFVAGSPEERNERQDLLRSGYARAVVGDGFAVYLPPDADS